jgi:uroporphyrinogen-III synthase
MDARSQNQCINSPDSVNALYTTVVEALIHTFLTILPLEKLPARFRTSDWLFFTSSFPKLAENFS